MNPEKIIILAKSDNTLSEKELNSKLINLKSKGWRILECTRYVMVNQNCTLQEASSIVLNSLAWIDKKDDFIKHQEEQMEEFLDAAKDNIESIQHTYSPDKTEIKYIMKKGK